MIQPDKLSNNQETNEKNYHTVISSLLQDLQSTRVTVRRSEVFLSI